MNDTGKLLLGPILALIPILVWELGIKPLRTRRNIALMLFSEVNVNLEEIAYYRVARETDNSVIMANLAFSRVSFMSVHASIGELPTSCVEDVLRFYAATDKIAATLAGLVLTDTRMDESSDDEGRRMLAASVAQGLRSLGHALEQGWELGVRVRTALHLALYDTWYDEPQPLLNANTIIVKARQRAIEHGLGTELTR